jgi:predicted phage terminase large subunit-like protein
MAKSERMIRRKPVARAPEEEAELSAIEEARQLEKQILALKRQKAIFDARQKFMPFVKFTMPDPEDPDDVEKSRYKNARHHDAIARVLEEVEKGEIPQLILCMPPRHGKSELTTRKFPAWVAGRNPRENVVVATYSDTFAEDFGREVRGLMFSPAFKQVFPNVRLMKGSAAADRLQTTVGGLMTFVGRGGALTGRGAHTLIIDDLIKDDKEAGSQAVRDQAWNWFTRVAMTRRMGKKRVIVIMTRWHSDDIVGRITDPENPFYDPIEAKKWKIINLPALAEDDDPLGRERGEPLWPDGPDRFDVDFLQSQSRLDPLGFSALYQQRPSAADGVLFKRENVRWYDPEDLPADLRMYAASDHALSEKERRDYTVLLAAGVDQRANLYLTDCYWERASTDKVVEAMLQTAALRKPLLWWAGRDHITKSIGPFLRKRMIETGTFFNLVEVSPSGDKESRAQAIAARMALGLIWFPKGAPWAERAVEELMRFPNGTHDDFVDAFALFGLGLQSQVPASVPNRQTKEPKYGTMGWIKWHEKKLKQHFSGSERSGW